MKTLIIISVIIALSYVAGVIWKKRELPCSLSAMVFELKGKWKWLWTAWMWAVTFTICIPTIEALPECVKFLGFLMMGSLIFVGAMPLFESETKEEHYTFAIIGGVLSQLCVAFICPWCLLTWLGMTAVIFLHLRDCKRDDERTKWYTGKGTFLAEVSCYVALVLSVCVRLL